MTTQTRGEITTAATPPRDWSAEKERGVNASNPEGNTMAKKSVVRKATPSAATAKKVTPKKSAKIKPRDEQKPLKGMEDAHDPIPEIDRIAKKYVHARDNRMAYGRDEIAEKGRIMAAMAKRGKKNYVSKATGLVVNVKPVEETIEVKAWKEPKEPKPKKKKAAKKKTAKK